jgi:hypothetical protein
MEVGKVVKAIVDRESSGSESMVIPNHISQTVLFMTRQGLEFTLDQDTPSEDRRKFVDKIIQTNKLDLYFKGIASLHIATGGILWLLQPTLGGYSIYWFHSGKENNSIDTVKSQYKVCYSPNGREIEEVLIRYEYFDNARNLQNTYGTKNKKWVRLKIRLDTVVQEFFEAEPTLDLYTTDSSAYGQAAISKIEYINTMGFIPCIESPNDPFFPGDSGRSDFAMMSEQIEAEDSIRGAILDNIFTFGNPTLITSRDSSEVMTKLQSNQSTSWAASQGFMDSTSNRLAGRRNDGGWVSKKQTTIKNVIGNVGADERFGYVFPDPVSPDQSRFADDYRAAIHTGLGGIDPSDSSFSTFGEIKSLYGKVAANARWKSLTLWKMGLCKILEMAIHNEERVYMDGFKQWLIGQDPKIAIEQVTQPQIEQLIWEQNINPSGLDGLKPYGNFAVSYRYNGDVFEDSPRDKLDRTIYTRNLQELGVGSLEAIDAIFPDLSLKEKKAKLSGIPFRLGKEYLGLFNTLLNQHQQLTQIEDPQSPGNALSLRYNLIDLMDSIYKVLSREFSYGSQYDDADLTTKVTTNGSNSLYSTAVSSNPISSTSSPNTGTPSISVATATGQPLPFDWANPPILPNSTVQSANQFGRLGEQSGSYGGSTSELGATQLWIPPRSNFNTTNPAPVPTTPVSTEDRPQRSNRKGRKG